MSVWCPAANIAEIARAMTTEEYADFPSIGQEMSNAADELDTAVAKLVSAIQTIQCMHYQKRLK